MSIGSKVCCFLRGSAITSRCAGIDAERWRRFARATGARWARMKAQIGRELDRLELLLDQIAAVEAERDAMLAREAEAKAAQDAKRAPAAVEMLIDLRGLGPDTVAMLWTEAFYRSFDNRRQLAAFVGLAGTPWQSGSIDHERGVSKGGNQRLRT